MLCLVSAGVLFSVQAAHAEGYYGANGYYEGSTEVGYCSLHNLYFPSEETYYAHLEASGLELAQKINSGEISQEEARGCKGGVDTEGIYHSGDSYTEPTSNAVVSRWSGVDAVSTSLDVASAFYQNKIDSLPDEGACIYSGNVVLATSNDFRDSMSATGLAGALDAPIILVDKDKGIDEHTILRLRTCLAENVYIVGGPAALNPSKVEDVINSELEGVNIERIYGPEAADTSVACAKRIIEVTGETPKYAVVAMSDNFADALSFSSFAYVYKVPILLETPGNTAADRTLTSEAKEVLNTVTDEVFVGGGTAAVSKESLADIDKVIIRISGNERYDTSNQIANFMVTNGFLTADAVTIACGDDASRGVDALAGSALAGQQKGVILLASGTTFSEDNNTTIVGSDSEGTASFLVSHNTKVSKVNVLGGTAVCTDNFMNNTVATALSTTSVSNNSNESSNSSNTNADANTHTWATRWIQTKAAYDEQQVVKEAYDEYHSLPSELYYIGDGSYPGDRKTGWEVTDFNYGEDAVCVWWIPYSEELISYGQGVYAVVDFDRATDKYSCVIHPSEYKERYEEWLERQKKAGFDMSDTSLDNYAATIAFDFRTLIPQWQIDQVTETANSVSGTMLFAYKSVGVYMTAGFGSSGDAKRTIHHDAEYTTVHHDAEGYNLTYCTECGAVKL